MSHPWTLSLGVGLGGFAGSIARYGLSVASQRLSVEWPMGTLGANVLGCLIIGFLTELSARGGMLSPELRLALATGFCGGFTTLSSLVYETAEMIRAHEYGHATAYVVGSILLAMSAFVIGIIMWRVLVKLGGGPWN